MHLVLPSSDEFARDVVIRVLKGEVISEAEDVVVIEVSGGGSLPTLCFSLSGDEMKKKRFAMKKNNCAYDVPVELHEYEQGDRCYLTFNEVGLSSFWSEKSNILGNLRYLSKEWHLPSGISKGRAGAVLFNKLWSTGKVWTIPGNLPKDIPINSVFQEITGYTQPVVTYGTTDAANIFELLQTIKAAATFKTSAVFDSYLGAHSVGDYWNRIPSPIIPNLDPDSRFSVTLNPEDVEEGLKGHSLCNIIELAVAAAEGNTFAGWYQEGMRLLAEYVLELAGEQVDFQLIRSEQYLSTTTYWNMNVRTLARRLNDLAGHTVGVIRTPTGEIIKSDDLYPPPGTIRELHEKGYSFAGAAFYLCSYSLGQKGAVFHLVKDGDKGEVHMLAKPFMARNSYTYLIPVGLFRLTDVNGDNENATIDPWVFLNRLYEWGEDKARVECLKLWEAMEVPLNRDNIARKTVATVNLDSIDIEVRN